MLNSLVFRSQYKHIINEDPKVQGLVAILHFQLWHIKMPCVGSNACQISSVFNK